MNHTVAVTSATRGAGTSAAAATLATVYADAGADVALVDCDPTEPSAAADLGIAEPDATMQDVLAGRATLREAVQFGPAGVAVLPGARFNSSDSDGIGALVKSVDGFDVVVCDTGDPFTDAAQGVLDAVDGVMVVSPPDDAAQRNAAALHASLRESGRPLLGTALVGVDDDTAGSDWDCELLATIPESDALTAGPSAVPESPSDPGVEAYRTLAKRVYQRLRRGSAVAASDSALWLPSPSNPFLTPDLSGSTSEDAEPISDGDVEGSPAASSADATSFEPESSSSGDESVADADDVGSDDSGSEDRGEADDDAGLTITRRGALAALAATAVGGVSAGVLNSEELPEMEAFGYGGRPVTSNESGTASATNGTTSAGAVPTGRGIRTEPADETGAGGTEGDLSGNETDTEGVGNTTESGRSGNTTAPSDDVSSETAPTLGAGGGSASGTEESTTAGGGGGNTGGTGSGGNTGGGDTGTGGGGTGSGDGGDDDATDDTTQSSDGQFGTVGYGQGGYGGVA